MNQVHTFLTSLATPLFPSRQSLSQGELRLAVKGQKQGDLAVRYEKGERKDKVRRIGHAEIDILEVDEVFRGFLQPGDQDRPEHLAQDRQLLRTQDKEDISPLEVLQAVL